jgi:hypothetical protein
MSGCKKGSKKCKKAIAQAATKADRLGVPVNRVNYIARNLYEDRPILRKGPRHEPTNENYYPVNAFVNVPQAVPLHNATLLGDIQEALAGQEEITGRIAEVLNNPLSVSVAQVPTQRERRMAGGPTWGTTDEDVIISIDPVKNPRGAGRKKKVSQAPAVEAESPSSVAFGRTTPKGKGPKRTGPHGEGSSA